MAVGLLFAAILVAVLIGFWGPLRGVRTALSVGHLVSTGHVFLLFGVALGVALGERTGALSQAVSPIVALAAGWVGFAAGMRFEVRLLRTLPSRAFTVAMWPPIVAAGVAGLFGALGLWIVGVGPAERIAVSLALAAVAAGSGPSLAAIVRGRRAGRAARARSSLRMVELSAGVDDLLVVLLAVVAFPVLTGELHTALALVAATLAGGAVLGAATWLFLGGVATEDERLLLGLGMLAFIAGFAEWLGLSPAVVAAIAAATLVNLPGARMDRLLSAVRRVERPAVVILMTLIGFDVAGGLTWLFVPFFVVLTLVRVPMKSWAGAAVEGRIPGAPGLRPSPRWALGLAPMGTLGLVVVLSFYHVGGGGLTRTLLAAAAAASVANEIAAPWLMVRLLRSLGGATPAQREAAS